MSLVVAHATDDGPRVVSDTRITFPGGPRSSFKTGSLKAVTLTPQIAVCLAGDVHLGMRGIRAAGALLGAGAAMSDVVVALTELTADERRVVEFLVAEGPGRPQITRIASGRVEAALSTAWIGDRAAFERFQQAWHTEEEPSWEPLLAGPPASTVTMSRLQRAMRAVIDDPAVESVDDFCVPVAYKEAGFEYLGSAFVHVGRDFALPPGIVDMAAAMIRPVEEGGYAVSVVEPEHPGTPALGLSFPVARLGMLYLPLRFDRAEVLTDVSPNDFRRVVLERYGVAMHDPLLRYTT